MIVFFLLKMFKNINDGRIAGMYEKQVRETIVLILYAILKFIIIQSIVQCDKT